MEQHGARSTSTNMFFLVAAVLSTNLPTGRPDPAQTLRLQRAAQQNDVDTLRTLLQGGADPDGLGENGFPALTVAANSGHAAALDELCARGATVNLCGNNGLTALHAAAGSGHLALVEALCARGASVHAATASHGMTPLMYAANAGHTAVVRWLCAHDPSLCGGVEHAGHTALHVAALNGRVDVVAALLDAGADHAVRGKDAGYTPLHLGAKMGHADVAVALVARGASLEAPSKEGHTPLHLACEGGHADAAEALLAAGADVHATSLFGVTPLHKAATAGAADVARLLLSRGASPLPLDERGDSPLHAAAHYSADVLAVLLEATTGDLRRTDAALWRGVLHCAAWRGSVEAMRLLLPAESDTLASEHAQHDAAALSSDLTSALAVATERGGENSEAVRYLLERGASAARAGPADVGVVGRGGVDAGVDGGSAVGSIMDDGSVSDGWVEKIRRMAPLGRQLLVDGVAPSGVSAAALLRESWSTVPYSRYVASKAALASGRAGAVVCAESALSAAACAALRAALDAEGTSSIDSVDRANEHVLYCGVADLERTIGGAAVRELLALPERFGPPPACEEEGGPGHARSGVAEYSYRLFDCFLRRYSADSSRRGDQLLTSFHADTATVTVNVALTSDADLDGGRLLGVFDGQVREIDRAEGDATMHSSALLHGVTRMRRGTRYSMILFFCRSTPSAKR